MFLVAVLVRVRGGLLAAEHCASAPLLPASCYVLALIQAAICARAAGAAAHLGCQLLPPLPPLRPHPKPKQPYTCSTSWIHHLVLQFGLVSDEVKRSFRNIREGSFEMRQSNHVVVLNWNNLVVPLLRCAPFLQCACVHSAAPCPMCPPTFAICLYCLSLPDYVLARVASPAFVDCMCALCGG